MTQQETIWIIVTACFASTFGVYVGVKLIKRYTRPPINSLIRGGDIELNYIEPSQPVHAYHPLDLNNFQFPTDGRITSYVPSYETGLIPSYRSGTLPSYHTSDRFYINSPLELNSWNFSLLLILIFLSIIIGFIIFKYFKTNLYSTSILIPFSYFEIDFRDSFEWEFNSHGIKPKITYLKIQTLTTDIEYLLASLSDEVNYSMSLSFISSYKEWKEDKGKIKPFIVENPIIINKESDPLLITQFIMENLNKKGYFITNWLLEDALINKIDPIILTATVSIKVDI